MALFFIIKDLLMNFFYAFFFIIKGIFLLINPSLTFLIYFYLCELIKMANTIIIIITTTIIIFHQLFSNFMY